MAKGWRRITNYCSAIVSSIQCENKYKELWWGNSRQMTMVVSCHNSNIWSPILMGLRGPNWEGRTPYGIGVYLMYGAWHLQNTNGKACESICIYIQVTCSLYEHIWFYIRMNIMFIRKGKQLYSKIAVIYLWSVY